jgi:hypothetical protein
MHSATTGPRNGVLDSPLPAEEDFCPMAEKIPQPPAVARKPSARTLLPRLLNLLLWLGFCALAGTGLLLAWRLPPASRGGRGLEILGFGRHDWGDFHTWIAYFFIAMIAVHLLLHWRWLWQVASRKRPWPVLAGLGLGIALVVAFLLAPVHKREGGRGGGGQSARSERAR